MPRGTWKPEVALPHMTVNEAYLLLGLVMLPGERLIGIQPEDRRLGPIVREGYRAVIEGDPTQLGSAKIDRLPSYGEMSS